MKKLIYLFIVMLTLCGCGSTTYFYQLYKTESNDITKIDNSTIVYQGKDIDIISDLWADQGNSSFFIINKTDSNIYVDLGHTHLIINGLAQTYFQNRIFSESSSSSFSFGRSYTYGSANRISSSSGYGSATYNSNYGYAQAQTYNTTNYTGSSATMASATTTASGHSVSYGEMKVICIPPHSGKGVDGFSIKSSPYRDCDLDRYPIKKNQPTKKFTQENTPYKIKNVITYAFDEDCKIPVVMELDYWVSEISNYSKKDFIESQNLEYCGEKSVDKFGYFKFESPKYFYIEYQKPQAYLFNH